MVLAYLLFLVATAPASWAAYGLSRASHGQLVLVGPRGSLWQGRGTLQMRVLAGSRALGTLRWTLHPAALLLGTLTASIRLDGPVRAHLRLARSLRELRVTQALVVARGSALSALSPEIRLVGPAGLLRLQVPRLVLTAQAAQGHGTLAWSDAGLALSHVRPLGSYELQFQSQGGALGLVLQTLSGPLAVAGRGSLQAAGNFAFAGTIAVPDADPRLVRLLQFVGTPSANNTRHFRISGQGPGWNQLF